MSNPRNCGKYQRNNGENCSFPAAPSRAHAEKDQREVDAPGNKSSADETVVDPPRTDFDIGPDAADNDAGGDKDETRPQRARNQFIQSSERRKKAIKRQRRVLALELAFLQKINDRGHRREKQGRIAKQCEHDMNNEP